MLIPLITKWRSNSKMCKNKFTYSAASQLMTRTSKKMLEAETSVEHILKPVFF